MDRAYVGQNEFDRQARSYLEADFRGRGACPSSLLCMEARSVKQMEHERWHDERFVHGRHAQAIPGLADRVLDIGNGARVVEVTAGSSQQVRSEALALFDRGVEEVYGAGRMRLGQPGHELQDSMRLLVLLVEGRLGGVLPCRLGSDGIHTGRWASPMCVSEIHPSPGGDMWTVLFAWIIGGYRGDPRAFGRNLVIAAVELLGLSDVAELAWQTPFTDKGAELVRRLLPSGDVRLRLHKPLTEFDTC